MKARSLLRKASLFLPVVAVVSMLVAANVWAILMPTRFDLTSAGVYSIGAQSRRVIVSIDRPVDITFFYDIRSKALTDSKALLEQYAAASPYISVRAFDPMLQPSQARRYQVNFPGTAVFESGDRRVVVNGGSETDFTNGLIRAAKGAAQRICFTDGHAESDPFSIKTHDHFEGDMRQDHQHSTGGRRLELHERHGSGMARDALETLGFEVTKVLPAKGPGQLDGCSVVVVASPQQPFQPLEARELRGFLAAGGSAVMLLEPFVDANLDGVLAEFGIAYRRVLVIDDTSHYWTDPASPAVSSYTRHEITRNLALTFFPGAGALQPLAGGVPEDLKVIPLVESSDETRLRGLDAGADTPSGAGRQALAVEARKRLPGSRDGSNGVPREARLVVVADGDFATNSYFPILGNGALFLNAVTALAGAEDLIDITPRTYELARIRLTNRQMLLTFVLSTLLLPGAALVTGVTVCWRRRR